MISHGLYHHQGRRVSDRPMVFWLKILGSVAPRMGVAEPLRRPTASRGRKRPRAAARLVGTSRAACCRSRLRVNPFLVWFVSLLVVVLWCVGNPDLWDRGLVCFWGTFLLWLVYPNLPIAWAQARARITFYLSLFFSLFFSRFFFSGEVLVALLDLLDAFVSRSSAWFCTWSRYLSSCHAFENVANLQAGRAQCTLTCPKCS